MDLSPPTGGLWHDLRDALRGTHHDYTSGALGRSIFLLAVPMVIEMAMESILRSSTSSSSGDSAPRRSRRWG